MSAVLLDSPARAENQAHHDTPSSPSFDADRTIKQHRKSVMLQHIRLVQTVGPILAAAQHFAELQAVTRALRQEVAFERQRGEDGLSKALTDACPMWELVERDDSTGDGGMIVLADLLRVAREEASEIARELEQCG